jgi:hypothetical protein
MCPSVRPAVVLTCPALAGCAGMGDGALSVEEALETAGRIQRAEFVTLEGTVDGNGFFVLAP